MATSAELTIRIYRMWPLTVAIALTRTFPVLGHWLVCKTMRIPETQIKRAGTWVTIGHPGDDLICLM